MKNAQGGLAGSTRWLVVSALFGALLLMAACGGSSSNTTNNNNNNNNNNNGGSGSTTNNAGTITPAAAASNVVALTVDGAFGLNNTPYITIEVCKPGSPPSSTTNCLTIPYVLVDTGSFGLRILNTPVSATPSGLTLTSIGLTPIASGSGTLAECSNFGVASDTFFTWGLVQKADVYISGETTKTNFSGGVPIQVLGDPADGNTTDATFPAIPTACGTETSSADSFNGTATVPGLGFNGILGIGPFIQDCGVGCQTAIPNPALYYSCVGSGSGATCGTGVTVSMANQVANPVAYFADNNGTIIELNNVTSSSGEPSITGSLVFGIGTQNGALNNNGLGSANVITTNGYGYFTTQFKGQSYPTSFIDSGSESLYFLDSGTFATLVGGNPLPACTESLYSVPPPAFYCPGSTFSSSATNVGANGNSISTSFSIANAESINALTSADFAYNDLGQSDPGSFDWGVPFFFGRYVYVGIYGVTPPSGVPAGPFFAY